MPAVSDVIIQDGATTPVARTFTPSQTGPGMVLYENRDAGIYIGFWKLVSMLVRPKGPSKVANRNLKVIHRLELPVLETLGTSDTGLTPPPTTAFRPMIEVVMTIPERSTAQQRKDLRTLMANYLLSTAGKGVSDDLSVPY